MPILLTDPEVDTALSDLPGWTREGNALVLVHELPTFGDAIAAVQRVGELAEAMDHHPDIDVRYRTLRLVCSTHSEGGLTELDVQLARAVSGALELG